jgi:quercetin dioxygenase-like cupin family protein
MQLITGDRLGEGHATPGMTRKEAFAGEGVWTGTVVLPAGTASAWHHHGEHRNYLYIVRGLARFENDAGEQLDARTGDFIFIGPHEVHREVNPGVEESEVVLFRLGEGPVVVNVEH